MKANVELLYPPPQVFYSPYTTEILIYSLELHLMLRDVYITAATSSRAVSWLFFAPLLRQVVFYLFLPWNHKT